MSHRLRVLITGAGGQLGRAILRSPAFSEMDIIALDRSHLNVVDASEVARVFSELRPDWVIHAAAMTGVDACEDDPVGAFQTNAFGAQAVARTCSKLGARLIVISTDYVFPGTIPRPMEVWDAPAPLSVYGRSKWAGELLALSESDHVWIVRTSYLYLGRGPSLFSRLLERALSGQPLRLVSDQTVAPTFALDLAESLADLARLMPPPGIYHISGASPGSPLEIGEALLRASGIRVPVQPVLLEQIAAKAPRPKFSVLSNDRARRCGVRIPRGWNETVGLFLQFFEDKNY